MSRELAPYAAGRSDASPDRSLARPGSRGGGRVRQCDASAESDLRAVCGDRTSRGARGCEKRLGRSLLRRAASRTPADAPIRADRHLPSRAQPVGHSRAAAARRMPNGVARPVVGSRGSLRRQAVWETRTYSALSDLQIKTTRIEIGAQ